MSYDFTMFEVKPNGDVYGTLSERERIRGPNLFNDESKQRSRAIANALRFKNPKLDWQPQAMSNFELIQVDSGPDGDGVQVSLFPNEVGVSIPYQYDGEPAREVLRQVWEYLKIVQQMTYYVILDPQLGRKIDLETDFETVLSMYLGTLDHIDGL